MSISQIYHVQAAEIAGDRQNKASGFANQYAADSGLSLSLDQHLIQRPLSTYICQVQGDAMQDAGIFDGDLLVVDASLPAQTGRIVVAVIYGELIIRRLQPADQGFVLVSESRQAPQSPIHLQQLDSQLFWGTVTWVLHRP